MIVECKSCLTKFRVADDKITARGIKVRCSKCQHTFMVRKDEAAAEAVAGDATKVSKPPVVPQASRTMQMYAVSPADHRTSAQAASFDLDGAAVTTDPFSVPDTQAARRASFDDGAIPPTNPLGPAGMQTSPQTADQATRRITVPAASADPFAAQATQREAPPVPGGDPFAAREDLFGGAPSFDREEVAPPSPWGAAPTTSGRPPAPDPFGATAVVPPPPPPELDEPGPDPFSIPPTAAAASAAGRHSAPPIAGPDPFAAMGPAPAAPGNGGLADPFAVAAGAGPGLFPHAPPGPAAGADPLGLPAGASPIQGSPEDIFGNLGGAPLGGDGPLPWDSGAGGDSFHNPLDAETRVRTVDGDMLKMLATYSQVEQSKVEPEVALEAASKPVPRVASEPSTVAPATRHPMVWHVMQGLLGLVLAGGVLVGVFHFRGGRMQDISPGQLLNVVLFGQQTFADSNLQTSDLDVSVYPLSDAQRVVVVTGQVHNRGAAGLPGVVVRGVLRSAEGEDVGNAEVYAGAVADPFDLERARTPRQVAARVRDRVARAGSVLEPGKDWPFTLVIAPQGEPDLSRTVVELDLHAADAPRAGASSEPAEGESDADPAAADGADPTASPSGTPATPDPAAAATAATKPAAKPAAKPTTRPPAKPPLKPAAKPARPATPADSDSAPPPPPPPPPPAAG